MKHPTDATLIGIANQILIIIHIINIFLLSIISQFRVIGFREGFGLGEVFSFWRF